MFKPAVIAVVVAAAVYACSQKEEAAPNPTQSSPAAPVNSSNTSTSSPEKAAERSRTKPESPQYSGQAAANNDDRQTAPQAQRDMNNAPVDGASPSQRAKQNSNKTRMKTTKR